MQAVLKAARADRDSSFVRMSESRQQADQDSRNTPFSLFTQPDPHRGGRRLAGSARTEISAAGDGTPSDRERSTGSIT